MSSPKNDKARKAWLAGLKDGESVAVVDDAGGVIGIGPIYRSERRGNIRVEGTGYFAQKIGRGGKGHWRATGYIWMVPLTDDLRTRHATRQEADRARDRLNKIPRFGSGGFREFTDAQILAVSAILWPESGKDGGK